MKQKYTRAAAIACGCEHWMEHGPSDSFCNLYSGSGTCRCADIAYSVIKAHDEDIKDWVNSVLLKEKNDANL